MSALRSCNYTFRVSIVALLWTLVHSGFIPPALANAGTPAGPSYWAISTRKIPSHSVTPGVSRKAAVFKVDSDGCLAQADLSALQEAIETTRRVVIYVPGNRSDFQSGHTEGWSLFQMLTDGAGSQHFVFLLWSWPADRITFGERSDIWIKACRADAEAFILADWLGNLPANTSVTLVTYSLSARAAAGSLHLLGGGEIDGRQLPTGPEGRTLRLRAILVGAAIDAHALGPGGAYEKAVAQADEIAITVHRRDTLLRLYPLLYGLRGPQALGFVGPTSLDPQAAGKITLIPVEVWTGKGHSWSNYFSALPVRGCLIEMATGP